MYIHNSIPTYMFLKCSYFIKCLVNTRTFYKSLFHYFFVNITYRVVFPSQSWKVISHGFIYSLKNDYKEATCSTNANKHSIKSQCSTVWKNLTVSVSVQHLKRY